jgi:hypothetical protein
VNVTLALEQFPQIARRDALAHRDRGSRRYREIAVGRRLQIVLGDRACVDLVPRRNSFTWREGIGVK